MNPRSNSADPSGQKPQDGRPEASSEPFPAPSDPARSEAAEGGPLVVGVLGGIASGKSEVGRLLAGEKGVFLEADKLAHQALASAPVVALLVENFGAEVLDADGQPDRAVLAQRVFRDPKARKRLEGWIHPAVRESIRTGLREAREGGAPICVLDVPLLLENDADHGLAGLCDFLVFVDVDADQREARAIERRGWERGEVARREAAQLPLDEKRARADFHLSNDGTLDELTRDTLALRERLLQERARRDGG